MNNAKLEADTMHRDRENERRPVLAIYADWPYWRPDEQAPIQEQRWHRHLAESVLPALVAIDQWSRVNRQAQIAWAATPVWWRLLERETGSRRFRSYLQRFRDAARESARTIAATMAQKPQHASTPGSKTKFRHVDTAGSVVEPEYRHTAATLAGTEVWQAPAAIAAAEAWHQYHTRPRFSPEQAEELLAYWELCAGDLIGQLRRLCDRGAIAPVACPAAAPQLAHLLTEESLHAQVMTARRELVRMLGRSPHSSWLPNGCGEQNTAIVQETQEAGSLPLIKLHTVSGPEVVDQLRWGLAEARRGAIAETGISTDQPSGWRLQPGTERLLRHLHEAEQRWLRLLARQQAAATRQVSDEGGKLPAGRQTVDEALHLRARRQAARELVLLQSCVGQLEDQPAEWLNHWGCFSALCAQLESGIVDEQWLAAIEQADDVLLSIEVEDFMPRPAELRGERDFTAELWSCIAATHNAVNVFMLAWEYPPKQVGGLACAVCDLAESLAQLGWTVHVVTAEHPDAPPLELLNGVHVHRVPVLRSGDTDFIDWTFEMNAAMVDYLVRWKELGGAIDLLHAHDWLVYQAARELKISFGVPLVATIHATESGRNQGGLHSELSQRIHRLEWGLTYDAARVFVCSEYMREEVIRLFKLPRDKTAVFPNGVRIEESASEAPRGNEEDERAPGAPDSRCSEWQSWAEAGGKIVLFLGRLVYEKGVQTLLAAMPHIVARVPEAKLIIAGAGPLEEEARRLAAPFGEKVAFAGFADPALKEQLYRIADLVVVPSLYEPFGIVALEAMSRGKPLVVSDTGGLADIVEHGVDGYKALPGHAESLAWHSAELLSRSDVAARMTAAAAVKLRQRYDWSRIAAAIADVYRDLLPVGASRGRSH